MRMPVILFPASGTRKSCLQTLSFGLTHTSVKLVLPAAVYQHYSQQAQRLQVLHFILFFFIRCLFESLKFGSVTCNLFQTGSILIFGFSLGVQSHSTYLARSRPKDPSGNIKNPHTNIINPSIWAQSDGLLFLLRRTKRISLCYDSARRSSSAWSTWSCPSLSSTVATHPAKTRAAWTRLPAPSSSPGCRCFTPTAMEIWKTSRKSQSTSSAAQRNTKTGEA